MRIENRDFTVRHKWDRTFFLCILLSIWAAILTGFGLDMWHRAQAHTLDLPLIVHLHAIVYMGWLVLLTVQILLIRQEDYRSHRRLGWLAVGILPLMLVLGPVVALVQNCAHYGEPTTDLAFMSTQFTNVIGSGGLIIAGLIFRKDPAAHKRLMLMGTIALTEPGFSRFMGLPLYTILGNGFWPYIAETYTGVIGLMCLFGLYDYVTRKRLHPAYVAALAWVLANELTATWLYYQPWWLSLARHMVGH